MCYATGELCGSREKWAHATCQPISRRELFQALCQRQTIIVRQLEDCGLEKQAWMLRAMAVEVSGEVSGEWNGLGWSGMRCRAPRRCFCGFRARPVAGIVPAPGQGPGRGLPPITACLTQSNTTTIKFFAVWAGRAH